MPTPYFVDRFNAVADRGTIDFEAWFARRREPDRSWDVHEGDWRFRHRYIPARPLLGRSEHIPLAELSECKPDLFVQEFDRFYLGASFLAARSVAGRTAFRALPSFDAWSDRRWWREASKHFLFRAADGAKVPGPDGKTFVIRYGMPADRISFVTQAIDVAHFQRARLIPVDERETRRREFGLKGCVFVYVGRLWSGKGLDYLVEAYRKVKEAGGDASLLLIGDGIDEDRYRTELASFDNVAFAGFVQPSDLPRWLALADVMVFPTLGDPNGLVVEESLAAGLPVIASDAAGDIRRRLPDERFGIVVPNRDSDALARSMALLANEPDLRRRMASETATASERYSLEAYAREFEEFVERVLSLPSRRTLAARIARRSGSALMWAARGPVASVEVPAARRSGS